MHLDTRELIGSGMDLLVVAGAAVLETPHSRLADGRPFAGLPSHHWGSDHCALACQVILE